MEGSLLQEAVTLMLSPWRISCVSCQLKDTYLVFLASSDSMIFSSFPVGTAVRWNDREWGQMGMITEALAAAAYTLLPIGTEPITLLPCSGAMRCQSR